MKRRNRTALSWPLTGLLCLLVTGWVPLLRAETTNCTPITDTPAVITTQGVYCFTGHLVTAMTSGIAIDIQANNVTIDLNGFKLGGLAAGDGTIATGIYAYQRKNITIRNGIVRGFLRGIYLRDVSPYTSSQGHVVEDLLVDFNTSRGIEVDGRGCSVHRNMIVETSGSTSDQHAYGIIVHGPGNDVIDNRVDATASSGMAAARGIYIHEADESVVEGNRVSETLDAGGNSYGIQMNVSDHVTVRNNTITTADFGVSFSSSTGTYMGNLTNDIGTAAFTGGTAVGTNN